MKKKLAVRLIPAAGNEALLKHAVHRRIEDLALTVRVRIGETEDALREAYITKDMLRGSGLTEAKLIKEAIRSTAEQEPAQVRTMEEVLGELSGGMLPFPGGMPGGLLVITNRDGMLGAGVISYPGLLSDIADRIGGDYYLLPSSIHEFLAYPAEPGTDWRSLEEMVRSVNENEVPVQEQLSDHVYRYSCEHGRFYRADRAERMDGE